MKKAAANKRRMAYRKRVRMYENDKQLLILQALSPEEYELRIQQLARKWKI